MKKTSKKTTSAKKTEITPTAWTRFLSSFIVGEIKRLGLDGYDREDNHWSWEEHEDTPGTYWVNYYAKSAKDYEQFKAALVAVVRRRRWEIDTDASSFAEAVASFGKDTSGKHKGRTLCGFYIAPAGTWEK